MIIAQSVRVSIPGSVTPGIQSKNMVFASIFSGAT
jgi:hypothetical protein